MRIMYIKLENIAGINVGMNKRVLEIFLDKAHNRIISIQGPNAVGKSVLMSSLTPFAYLTSMDERSTLSYIIQGKNGYKEIHYQDNDDIYIIKHYYKANKDTHSVKSYFMRNGEELNENGNVSSFVALVELYFGLTPDMMRLIRLGSNVSSLVSLGAAKRKDYIGRLIEEINIYLSIHKNVNDELKVVKSLINTNNRNLMNCHISNIDESKGIMKTLHKKIKKLEKERDGIIAEIAKSQSLLGNNNLDDLNRKLRETESSLIEFNRVSSQVRDMKLSNVDIKALIDERTRLMNMRTDCAARIASYRMNIDSSNAQLERIDLAIRKISANFDIESLKMTIDSIRKQIEESKKNIKNFQWNGISSETISSIIGMLDNFNQISRMMYNLGKKPVRLYVSLKRGKEDVDKYLKKHRNDNAHTLSNTDIRVLMDQLFQDEQIISPNCNNEYLECPYYRFSEMINKIQEECDEVVDPETLRSLDIINHNMRNILVDIYQFYIQEDIPEYIRTGFSDESIMKRFESMDSLFDTSELQSFRSLVRECEILQQNRSLLSQYETQLKLYNNAGIGNQMEEMKIIRASIEEYRGKIELENQSQAELDYAIENVDKKISVLSRYNDGKKVQALLEQSLDDIKKKIKPLQVAEDRIASLRGRLDIVDYDISNNRKAHRALEDSINEYVRLTKEAKGLAEKFEELSIILESVSTKKGIPVVYISQYLGKIQQRANDLLDIIYNGKLELDTFNVTQDTFEIPFRRNGILIPDVKYGSQSEIAMITMVLSFALSSNASEIYNITMLDEIDAGLDEASRPALLQMIHAQMGLLQAEQLFIISQNINQMANVPMDCIRLGDVPAGSKLQNVIYDACA